MHFLKNCQHRAVLNGQFSLWINVFHRDQFLGPSLFLIFVNDFSNNLQCNPKLVADGASLFSTVRDITTRTVSLNRV